MQAVCAFAGLWLTLQYIFVVVGALVLVLGLAYVLTTLPELRFRGMWPCPRCQELGSFLGTCSNCGQRTPGLVAAGRWFGTFFGPILAVGAVFVVLCLVGSLRTPFLWAFLLGIPFAGLLFLAWSLLFSRRAWLCPQCKEPGSFFGRCEVCGQRAPGLLHSLGHLGIVAGVLIVLAWVWLAADLVAPHGGRADQEQPPAVSPSSSAVDADPADIATASHPGD
ncbi:MAG: hypothetical protein ACODAJ_10730 [Planctomycetota bacterium]